MAEAVAKSSGGGILKNLMKHTDLMLAIAVVMVILFLIIPMPIFLLDAMLAINIVVGLIILLTVTYLKRGADFNVFPSIILLTTLFRIVLNVSSTRLILSKGKSFTGKMIIAFGEFVVGKNVIVGLVIFLILIALQFMVITKGATRVAEVAARFTLDGMPVKMMSVDTEVAQGKISEDEAQKKKDQIRQESDFYGSMDGATKFVSGDVKLGFLITVINIIGGLVVGITQGMSVGGSFNLFAKFTVGDGLVSQIPSILISLATGLIVTRAVSNNSLGRDISRQLIYFPRAMYVVAGFMFILAFVPGLPTITLLLLAIGISSLGFYVNKMQIQKKEDEIEREKLEAESQKTGPEDVAALINVEPIEFEIGFNLVPLVDTEAGGDLLERIKMIRRSCALDLGIVVPPIRIRDNMKLKPNDYAVKIRGIVEGKGTVKRTKYFAIPQPGMEDTIEGEPTIDPTFGRPAKWIDVENKEKAERMGYAVVDPATVISTHLTAVIQRNADELLGRKEVHDILESIRAANSTVVDEVSGIEGSYGTIQKVLANLLKEQVSIRNMVSVLETLADYKDVRNTDMLTELVRQKLAKHICSQYVGDDNVLYAFNLDQQVEYIIEQSLIVQANDTGIDTNLDPLSMKYIVDKIYDSFMQVIERGEMPILLTNANVRLIVKRMTMRRLPELPVLSYLEVIPSVQINSLGVIEVPEIIPPPVDEEEEWAY